MIKKILLIDDSNAVNQFNKALLQDLNLFKKIETSTNPWDVLESFEHDFDSKSLDFLPEMIFLDIEMPEMDAFRFLEIYRKLESIIASKFKPFIVIISDHLLDDDNFERMKKYSQFGVGDQLKKPFEKVDIEDVLVNYYERLKE